MTHEVEAVQQVSCALVGHSEYHLPKEGHPLGNVNSLRDSGLEAVDDIIYAALDKVLVDLHRS